MQEPSPNTPSYSAFTLVEVLVVIVIAAVLLAGFTGFYLSEQRTVRHDQIEIETSQALRTALEQMGRASSARKMYLTFDYLTGSGGASPSPSFITATATAIEFTLDANDNELTRHGRSSGAQRIQPGHDDGDP